MFHWAMNTTIKMLLQIPSMRKKYPYSGLYFPTFELSTETADQNNSEYGYFSCSAYHLKFIKIVSSHIINKSKFMNRNNFMSGK